MQTPNSSSLNLKVLLIGVTTIATSFAVGIQTAGDIHPISLIEAGDSVLPGDIDNNGRVDLEDAVAILEVVQGYTEPTAEALRADPNSDGVLTVDDALRILHEITLR